MKLILAIVSNLVEHEVEKALVEQEHKSTKLASYGQFRKSGNATFVVGALDDEVDGVIQIIRKAIEKSKIRERNPEVADANIFLMPMVGNYRM